MSWASRRRFIYGFGVTLFLAIVIGIPTAIWLYEPPTCFDGKQNHGETAADKGGPCRLLDERALSPHAVLWSRAFLVRGGVYNAVAYVENPNREAGVRAVGYRFGLYDERNVLVAERFGTTYVMPGGITPVFEGAIDTGNRAVARTYFEFTSRPVWERLQNAASVVSVGGKSVANENALPRLTAAVENTSVAPVLDPLFVAVVFDAAGNAFAASATTLTRLEAGEKGNVVFTWPDPLPRVVGRIDVLPRLPPISL